MDSIFELPAHAPQPAPRSPDSAPANPAHLLTAARIQRQHGRGFVLFQPFADRRIVSTLALFPGFDLYVLLSHTRSPCLPEGGIARPPLLPGTLPTAARGLCSCVNLAPVLIRGLHYLGLDLRAAATVYADGHVRYARDRSPAHALRLDFGRRGQPTQRIFHVKLDASNSGMAACPEFLDFMGALPSVVTILRGATGALAEGGFSHLKTFIMGKSSAIVEDEDCLPYASLRLAGYYVRLQETWARAVVELCEHLPATTRPECRNIGGAGQVWS